MNVVIYDKKSLEIIARPIITSLENFKINPNLFYQTGIQKSTSGVKRNTRIQFSRMEV